MKTLILLLFGCAASYGTTVQTLVGSAYLNQTSKTSSQYWSLSGENTSGAAANTQVCTVPMPAAGYLGNIRFILAGAPDTSGSGKGYNVSLVQNGTVSGTATLAVTGSGTTGIYSGSIHYAVDDQVCLNVAETGSPANSPRMSWLIDFTPDTAGVNIFLGTTASTNFPANGVDHFVSLNGDSTTVNTAESGSYLIMPMSGTITNFTFYLATTPGSGNTRQFKLKQCSGASCTSSPVGTAITYTAAQNGICSSCPVSQSISFSAGDLFDIWQTETLGTVPTASAASWGVAYTTTTQGQFVIPVAGTSGTLLSTSAVRYVSMAATCCQGGGTAWPNATRADVQNLIYTTTMVLEGYYVWFSTSPSPGTYTIALELNGAAAGTTYSTAFSTQGPTASSNLGTSYTLPTSAYNLYDSSVTPGSTPTAAYLIMSYIGYIAPSGTSTKIRHSVK